VESIYEIASSIFSLLTKPLVESHWTRVHGTTCVGEAASMAALLLTAGTPKRRFSLPNSRILIHQPSMSGLSGQATDIDIHAKEILRMRSVINQLLADHSGQSIEKIEQDVERDFIMSAQQAKEYGLIDEIIHKHG
jgi:ATP-dependent Clp protease, protease subunit